MQSDNPFEAPKSEDSIFNDETSKPVIRKIVILLWLVFIAFNIFEMMMPNI
jgi:hypothetical protein